MSEFNGYANKLTWAFANYLKVSGHWKDLVNAEFENSYFISERLDKILDYSLYTKQELDSIDLDEIAHRIWIDS
jgi:hypothetical protein